MIKKLNTQQKAIIREALQRGETNFGGLKSFEIQSLKKINNYTNLEKDTNKYMCKIFTQPRRSNRLVFFDLRKKKKDKPLNPFLKKIFNIDKW